MKNVRERWRTADGLSRWSLAGIMILLVGGTGFAACVLCALAYLGAQRAAAPAPSGETPAAGESPPPQVGVLASAAPSVPATRPEERGTPAAGASAPASTPGFSGLVTATARPDSASAIPLTTSPPAEQDQTLSGTGSGLTSRFALGNGLTVFRIKHSGSQAFNVWLADGQGKHLNQLIGAQGAFDGGRALGLEAGTNYALDVKADGAWTVLVQQPVPSASDLKLPQTFSGRSAQASPFLVLKDGTLTFRLSYTGSSGVSIWLLDQNGVRQVLLARSATSTATQTAEVSAGSYLLDIAGQGDWSLTLTQ